MRKIVCSLLLLSIVGAAWATDDGQLAAYRRNAIATMLVYHSEDEFGGEIYRAFQRIPTPDKYDDHSMGFNVILNDSLYGARRGAGLIKAQLGKQLNQDDVAINAKVLERYLNRKQVGTLLVSKWFGMDFADSTMNAADGFNMKLIQQRGQYDASDVDVRTALLTPRGLSTLSDAGEELISHTFILVNDITYVTSEEKAAVAKVVMSGVGALLDGILGTNIGRGIASVGGAIADSYTGFDVKTHSYLFQLQWNDSIAAVFYNNYYTELPQIDTAKLIAFLRNDSLFRVKYVAHEFEYDDKAAVKGKYERTELVKMACTKSMDKNIASLQLAWEDFKVKTPVYDVVYDDKGRLAGYTAAIGMKEGITESGKFQVLQREVDPVTNRTSYRYIASLKPVPGKIWDNRYNAVTEGSPEAQLQYTLFKKTGGGEILPGMLITEGKYKKAK